MEATRRVELKAFEKSKDSDIKPVKLAIRFEIKLEASTDEKCPEISYTDLLLKHERKRRRTNSASRSSGVVSSSCCSFIHFRHSDKTFVYVFIIINKYIIIL